MPKAGELYLLYIMKERKRQRDAFVSKCQEDTNRIEKPICKVNFIKKNKWKQVQNLEQAKKGTHDTFGKLYVIIMSITHFSVNLHSIVA